LQIELDPYELNLLCDKFDSTKDGRINYIEFLKPWAGKTQLGNIAEIFHEKGREPSDDTAEVAEKMTNVTGRLRSRLIGDVKNLRKAFRKLDDGKSGYLTVAEFRSVLEMCNIVLDEEEAFQLAARYDASLQGKMKYDNFIKDLKNEAPSRNI
jgi:Ca2+-binding EF-hand superfamily protein